MSADRYVIVSTDANDMSIIDGPILWDPDNAFDPGEGLHLIGETEALAAGYSRPPEQPD
jgi:hypothetical protein